MPRQGVLYEYIPLIFGLSAALRIFAKVLKPALVKLRLVGIHLVAYLDDLIIGSTKKDAEAAFPQAKELLQCLGFIIYLEISQCQASQKIKFLGFVIHTKEVSFQLPQMRLKLIRNECKTWLLKAKVSQ